MEYGNNIHRIDNVCADVALSYRVVNNFYKLVFINENITQMWNFKVLLVN